jgi:RND family efflux transporter MFP subunit
MTSRLLLRLLDEFGRRTQSSLAMGGENGERGLDGAASEARSANSPSRRQENRPSRFLRAPAGLAGAALLCAVTLAPGCRKATPEPPRPPTVTVSAPARDRIVEWNEYTGRLASIDGVEIRPRVSGYVDAIHFVEAQRVKEGDLLFVIDRRPFEAEVARARAKLSQAKAAQSLARANLQRAQSLQRSQTISKEEAEIRLSESQQADADVEEAQAELDAANLQLQFTEIRSPISGIAGRYLVSRGNLVQGGSGAATLLTTVVPHDPIYVYFESDEAAVLSAIRRYFAGRSPGRGEPGSRPVEMQLADESGFPHKGEIDFVDNQLNSDTATMLIRGKFENEDYFFTPGMFARVRVPAGKEQDALMVPEEAIVSDLTARFVWLLGPDDTVERRKVETGARHGALRVIREGLAADDKVVIRGVQVLRPGSKVTPQEGQIPLPGKPDKAQPDG